MNKCKLCGMEFKSEDLEKHDGYCEVCNKKVIKEKELVDQTAAKILSEMESKKAEDDLKAKIEVEAKAKADAEFAKRQGTKEDLNAGLETLAPKSNTRVKKLDVESQAIYDALKSGNKETSLKFEIDVNGVENNLLEARKMEKAGRDGHIIDGIKANLDGASSYGAEFVPQEWSSNYYMRMATMDGDLMNYFPKVGMNTNIKNISELLTYPTVTAYKTYANQNLAVGAVTATDVTTSEGTLTARKFVAKINVYNDLLDDDKFGLMRGVKTMLGTEFGSQVSNAILNGDDSTTHMDQDIAAASANHPLKMFKGLRYRIISGSLGVDGDTTYTLSNLKSVRSKMGKYALGRNKKNCIWIMNAGTSDQLDGLLEALGSAREVGDFIVREGSILRYLGYPIILSEHQREDLEISGYYDESGTAATQGFCSLVNTSQFLLGIRKTMNIKIVDDPTEDRKVVIGTMRFDFKPFEDPSTTVPSAAGMYAYTVA